MHGNVLNFTTIILAIQELHFSFSSLSFEDDELEDNGAVAGTDLR